MPVYTFCLSDFWISDPFSTLRGALFGIWISDFRVLDFEEGGAAELGGWSRYTWAAKGLQAVASGVTAGS